MKNILLFSAAFIFVFTSCEDILTKNLELEEFDFEKQMAISGELNSLDDTFRLLISENKAITDQFGEWEALVDAEAFLYQEETLIGQLSLQEQPQNFEDEANIFELDLENIDLSPGEYRLEVTHPDYDMATATTEIPEDVPLVEIEYVEEYGIAPTSFEKSDAILITFNDPPEENYYNISLKYNESVLDTFISGTDTFYFVNQPYFDLDSRDPDAQVDYDNILLTDGLYNGEQHTVVVYVVNYSYDGFSEFIDDFQVSWEMLSKDQYDFNTSLMLYNNSQDLGPFSEAVSLYNNIDGGLGIFAGINRRLYDIP